jgi:hypothetical protein
MLARRINFGGIMGQCQKHSSSSLSCTLLAPEETREAHSEEEFGEWKQLAGFDRRYFRDFLRDGRGIEVLPGMICRLGNGRR